MAAPKFADLPGIVWNEPEVYETSNTPEGHQAELEAAWNEPEVYETGDMLKGDQAELEVLPAAAAEELAKCRTEAPVKSPAKALTSIGDMVTFEVYWRPGQDQFALDAKIVELEKRLAQLEATVQCKPISQNLLLVEPMGSSLLETAQILQAKVNILDEVMLDQIEARLKSILGKVKEIAEHEATLQCANSQSKIHQTYELMQHWDPIASSLPDVVQYLLTLRDLHKEATQVGQVLEDMETMQKEIADALQVNTFLLEVVQKTMKEFLAFVEENVAETEASIRKLQK
ncbi:dynactin subunit 2-like isoform X4 [Anser cygnoides]|uniref:Dynactin subunit 2 n=2 Tax=Anser cygnoides TaxID=8845 RepID=A0A8B9DXA7_ANSCY|nr:dynactin subunit 2-like isoform X5 [Anser cygnoides]